MSYIIKCELYCGPTEHVKYAYFSAIKNSWLGKMSLGFCWNDSILFAKKMTRLQARIVLKRLVKLCEEDTFLGFEIEEM